MKLYIINEIDAEGHKLQTLMGASPNKEEAQAECGRLNFEAAGRQGRHYELVEVEVASFATAHQQAKAARMKALEASRAAFLACCHALFETLAELQSFDLKLHDRGWGARAHGVSAADRETDSRVVAGFLTTLDYEDLTNLFGEDASLTVHRDGTIVRFSDDIGDVNQAAEECLCPDCIVQSLERFFQVANLHDVEGGDWRGDPEEFGIRDVHEWKAYMNANLHWMSANAEAVLDVLPSLEAEWPDNCEKVRQFFERSERERGLAG